MKNCRTCGDKKPYTEFNKQTSSRDGFCGECRDCGRARKREDYLRNRDKYLEKQSQYRKENAEKVSEGKKRCYRNKIDQYKQNHRRYYQENKEAVLAQAAEYREANKEEIRKRDNAYKENNREKLRLKQSEYQRANSEVRNEYTRKYRKNRRQVDRMFGIKENMRARFRYELAKRGDDQHIKANEYLGCSWVELRIHLENQFKDGMSWDNYGDWHVDHIIPLASARTKDELIKLCHYSNLQPLWAFDNLSKGAKMPDKAA